MYEVNSRKANALTYWTDSKMTKDNWFVHHKKQFLVDFLIPHVGKTLIIFSFHRLMIISTN